jgi:hypothetical protein
LTTSNDDMTFTAAEVSALRHIVEDWLGEELVVPPYKDGEDAVLRKLGCTPPVLAERDSVVDNHVTARPGPRSL